MVSSTLSIDLHNAAQAKAIIKAQLYPFLANWLASGKQLILTAKLKTRTSSQNRRYWGNGVLAQISNQATVGGQLYSAETWHEMFKRKFLGVEQLPDGGVIGKSSTGLTTAEFCEFCQQIEAYAVTELGVKFYELHPL